MSHCTAVQQLPGYKLDQEAHYQTEYMLIGNAFLCSRITVLYALIGDFLFPIDHTTCPRAIITAMDD